MVSDPIRTIPVIAASHHRHVLIAHVLQLTLVHHVDLVLGAVHHTEVRDRVELVVQTSQLQYLVAWLVTIVCWGRVSIGWRSMISTIIMTTMSCSTLSVSLVAEEVNHGSSGSWSR